MNNKLAIRFLAVILCFITVFTVFVACSDDTDKVVNNPGNQPSYVPDWVIEPSISAQTIQPLARVEFNENTNHYDVSYAACFKIMINGKYGIIDYNGDIVIPAEYDDIFAVRDGDDFIGVKKGVDSVKQTYIHSDTFKTQPAHKKYNAQKFEYYWNVESSSAVFVSVEDGNIKKEDFRASLPETVKGVKITGGKYTPTEKYGLFSNSRNVTGLVYTGAGVFTDGLAAFESNGKWGYINSDGRTVVPFEYDAVWGYNALGGEDTAYECSEGHITVCKNKKFGILKDDGSVLVEPMFEDATPVVNGKSFVKHGGKYGVIRVYGNDGNMSDVNSEEDSSVTKTTTSTSTSTTTTTKKTSTTTQKTSTDKSDYSKTTSTTSKTTTTTEPTTAKKNYKTGTYTVTLSEGGSLNLRNDAGMNGQIVSSLKNGSVVYVDKISNGWGHTVYNGTEGWFNLNYAEMN